jgi:hypothetical protein
LDESQLVPVYPQVDVDFDGSGDLTQRDYRVLVEAYGARKGMERYDERLDILPDGEIDDADLVAFRFNLVHAERARRLKLATPESSMEQARP